MSFVHVHPEEPRESISTKGEQLSSAYSKELTLRTTLSSHKLPSMGTTRTF